MSGPGTILGHITPVEHDADEIVFDPTNTSPGITATDVQAAIEAMFASGTSPNLDGGRADEVYFALVINGGSA